MRIAEIQSRVKLGDPTLDKVTIRRETTWKRTMHLVLDNANALCTGEPVTDAVRPVAPLAVMLEHKALRDMICRDCIEALP